MIFYLSAFTPYPNSPSSSIYAQPQPDSGLANSSHSKLKGQMKIRVTRKESETRPLAQCLTMKKVFVTRQTTMTNRP